MIKKFVGREREQAVLQATNAALTLDKSDVTALRERIETFRQVSKTSKHIFGSFLTTFGVKMNENTLGLVDNNLDTKVLFEP